MILTLVTVRGMIFSSRWIHAIIHYAFGYYLDDLLIHDCFPLRILRPFDVTLAFYNIITRIVPAFDPFPAVTCTTSAPSITKDLGMTRNGSSPQRMVHHEWLRKLDLYLYSGEADDIDLIPENFPWSDTRFSFSSGWFSSCVFPACKWVTSLQYFMSRHSCVRTSSAHSLLPLPRLFSFLTTHVSQPTRAVFWLDLEHLVQLCTLPPFPWTKKKKYTLDFWNCVCFWWHGKSSHERSPSTLPSLYMILRYLVATGRMVRVPVIHYQYY